MMRVRRVLIPLSFQIAVSCDVSRFCSQRQGMRISPLEWVIVSRLERKGEAPDITYVSGALGSDERKEIRPEQVKLTTFVEFLKGRLKGGQSDGRWCFRSGYFGKGKLKEPQG